VVGVHLYANAEERLAQAARLVELFAEEKAPVILAGDFNSIPESRVLRLLEDAGGWQRPAKEGHGKKRLLGRQFRIITIWSQWGMWFVLSTRVWFAPSTQSISTRSSTR